MKKGITWILLTCLVVASLVLASCNKTTSSTSTPTQTTTTTTKTTTTTNTTNSTTPTTTTATTTAVTGHWWDSLGTPQYGGTMTVRLNQNVTQWDPMGAPGLIGLQQNWMDRLTTDDWTLDPAVFSYNIDFRPAEYEVGSLASSWEFTDPSTYVIHLRNGIHWQNISPVNGREFVASDVVFHYDRMMGLGGGFTTPSPYWGPDAFWSQLQSITANDKYTVTFKWKMTNPEVIRETVQDMGAQNVFEAPEAVNAWGNLNDWHHAMGTGPFILTDFVDSSSATMVRNPNYWGYDERYPKNQLPYVDSLKILIIPDDATALSALRTGKIDFLDSVPFSQAQSMQKSNPKILQIAVPNAYGTTIDPRNDVTPFNDIRVRKAMQMALDLPTITATYFGGTCSPNPLSLTSDYMIGWGFPYSQWPQDLKDEYAYNPTAAKQLLASAGYPNGFNTDIVVDTAFDMDLLQIVKSYFNAIGINMTIRPMDPVSWTAYVKSGHKQDQMAALSGRGQLGATIVPIRQLSSFNAGYMANWCMVNDPTFSAFYNQAMAVTSSDAMKTILENANQYVAKQHYTISLLQSNIFTLYQPWLKGYTGQTRSIWGPSGAFLMGFYASRFWIDQNLKESMGY